MAAIRGTWDAVVEGRNHLYGRTWSGTEAETAVARVSADSIEKIEPRDPQLRDCQTVVDEARLALEQGVGTDPVTALLTVGARVATKLSPLNGAHYLAGCFAEAEKLATEPTTKALARAGWGLGGEWFLIPSDAQGAFASLREGMLAVADLLARNPQGTPERACATAAVQAPQAPKAERHVDSDRVFVAVIQKYASSEEVATEAAHLFRDGTPEERRRFLVSMAPNAGLAAAGFGALHESKALEVQDDVVRIGSITLGRRPEHAG